MLPSQYAEKRQAVASLAPAPLVETRHSTSQITPPVTSSMSYMGHTLGAGPAIAAAASQAIAATQQVPIAVFEVCILDIFGEY